MRSRGGARCIVGDRPCAMLDASSLEACSSSSAEDAAHMRKGPRARHSCALPPLHPSMHATDAGPGSAWRAAYGGIMGLDLLMDRGTPIERQRFTWKELVQAPISKLDADAFTRVRIILMNGLEAEANRFMHAAARLYPALQRPLAVVRRIEQHQQTLVNWLLPPDQTPLETTIGYEQTAIEVTASLAESEPDPYMAAGLRVGALAGLDHLDRVSAPSGTLE